MDALRRSSRYPCVRRQYCAFRYARKANSSGGLEQIVFIWLTSEPKRSGGVRRLVIDGGAWQGTTGATRCAVGSRTDSYCAPGKLMQTSGCESRPAKVVADRPVSSLAGGAVTYGLKRRQRSREDWD